MNQNDPNRNQQNPDSADQGHLPRRDRSGVQDAPEKGLREDRPEIERTADLDDLETDGQDMEDVGGQGFAQGRGGNPGEVDPRFRRSAPGPSSEREERSREADVGEAAEQDADTEGKTHGSNEQDPPPTVPYGQRVEDRD